ncbi:CobQ/CobB/MinD/ParA nucleotide binding domain protein [Gimesia maris]|uniref:AAA family ATPase n=1 Tax=Gimesia maris TaxID=122 RepID=UPI00118ABC06|nr:AAA family ATPase [Gimesia maris]QDU16202.1 CobQ/CobB/MinD/ParA nucleotide binding domain protein [Gimesia maris]
MSSSLQQHLLVISPDTSLKTEVEQALSGKRRHATVVHEAHDLTLAVDLTRDLSPQFVIADVANDLDQFKSYLREIQAVSPQTLIAGVFHPSILDEENLGSIFVEGMRAGAQDFLRRPISSKDLNQFLDRPHPAVLQGQSTTATTIAFLSNKGGVGKSTLAVNVATRLAQKHPGDVLLIDASLQMGVCAPMLNLRPETSLIDAIRERQRLDSTLIRQLATPHSSGLELLAAPPNAVAALEIDDQLMTRVLNLARRTYRYVVIDTFPLFDRIVMSVLDTTDLAFIVLDNVVPTVLSIRHLLELLDNIGHPEVRQRIVVNRMTSVTGHPTVQDIQITLGRPIDYVFPYDKQALTAANLGQPFALRRSWWSKLDKNLQALVQEIENHRRSSKAVSLSTESSMNEPYTMVHEVTDE